MLVQYARLPERPELVPFPFSAIAGCALATALAAIFPGALLLRLPGLAALYGAIPRGRRVRGRAA